MVGQGDFAIRTPADGLGEVKDLGVAINWMLDGLERRDREISELLIEQTEKVRLEAELKIAQGIQANLLPAQESTEYKGISIAADYFPATECAGDWYHYHHNASGHETIVVIADVSGHGAGSSIFTALIAGIYADFCAEESGPWDIERFFRKTSQIIHQFGRGSWHASMMVARYSEASSTVDVYAAGHPPAFYHDSRQFLSRNVADAPTQPRYRKVLVPGEVLGLSDEPKIGKVSLAFAKGDSLFLYTDGLVEAKNAQGRMLTARALESMLRKTHDLPASQSIGQITSDWKSHKGNAAAPDDVCVVYLKAS
jgi:sigma-B regulation protein RsbU (phosphoserine phosphatase)